MLQDNMTAIDAPAMLPTEIRAARHSLGLSQWELATLLGYSGTQRRAMMEDLETGRRPLREPQRRLLESLLLGYVPPDWNDVTRGKVNPFAEA